MKKRFLCVLLVCFMLVPCFCLGGCRKETFTVKFIFNSDKLPSANYNKTISGVEKGSLIKSYKYADHTISYMEHFKLEFGGWFQEPECTNPWAFYTDRVYCDINLYVKWIPI